MGPHINSTYVSWFSSFFFLFYKIIGYSKSLSWWKIIILIIYKYAYYCNIFFFYFSAICIEVNQSNRTWLLN